MKIVAVSGSTGRLGRLVIARLKERLPPPSIVALARTPAKGADLGVEVREADYSRPETLDTAMEGVHTLLLISSSEVGQRARQHANVIAAAKAGVARIVYTSLLHADTSPIKLLSEEHLATEVALKASGIGYTILRNSWYTENYTGSAAANAANGELVGCAGDAKICSAPREDYADAAAKVAASEGHLGMVYELAGDEPYTLSELASEISRQTSKTTVYKNVSCEEYAEVLIKSGLSEGMANAFATISAGVAQGALFDDGRQLSKLLNRATASLAKSIEAALKP